MRRRQPGGGKRSGRGELQLGLGQGRGRGVMGLGERYDVRGGAYMNGRVDGLGWAVRRQVVRKESLGWDWTEWGRGGGAR